jgi:hypothetical protein
MSLSKRISLESQREIIPVLFEVPKLLSTCSEIWRKTTETPAGNAMCRNPLERLVRVSLAQARGKRSCFAEYQLS